MFKKYITDSLVTTGMSRDFVKVQKRLMMLLHEYQAQGLLKKYSLPVPRVILNNSGGSCPF